MTVCRCPSRIDSESMEDSQSTMMCLVCGELVCANSYCCQSEENKPEGGVVKLGGFTKHARRYMLQCTRLSVERGRF